MPRSRELEEAMELVREYDSDPRPFRAFALSLLRHDSSHVLHAHLEIKPNPIEKAKALVSWQNALDSNSFQDIYCQICTNNIGAAASLGEKIVTEYNREIKAMFDQFLAVYHNAIIPVYRLFGWTPPEIFGQVRKYPRKNGWTTPTEAVANLQDAYVDWFMMNPGSWEQVQKFLGIENRTRLPAPTVSVSDLPDLRGATPGAIVKSSRPPRGMILDRRQKNR